MRDILGAFWHFRLVLILGTPFYISKIPTWMTLSLSLLPPFPPPPDHVHSAYSLYLPLIVLAHLFYSQPYTSQVTPYTQDRK